MEIEKGKIVKERKMIDMKGMGRNKMSEEIKRIEWEGMMEVRER